MAHNGSGKSTLMRLLSGDITPTSGSILVDGLPLHQLSTKEAAKHIAYLPQRLPGSGGFLSAGTGCFRAISISKMATKTNRI
ncbi:ATP-binding cassette domain-containing protein [Mannheimia haemolytica]|uniref:ATP-binding cassette domain-containing protein n=1 Tax=Mannheimia haemolytica TaxID=75985 RepID=UPI0038F77BBB